VPFNPTLLLNGDVTWYDLPRKAKFGVLPDARYEERGLDGSLVRRVGTVGTPTDLHEIQQLPNGHFLLDAYRPRGGVDLRRFGGPRKGTVYYGEVQEVTQSGRRVWRWSSRVHVALAEARRRWPNLIETQSKFPKQDRWYDYFHINSIAPDGDGLVISGRHVDAVYRIDRATGRVGWKLGGTKTKRSLSIVGDPRYGSTTFGGQHDARVLPDGTLTVFDNGAERDRAPRLLRYRIDTKARTATLLEQLTDPSIPTSTWGGGTRKLAGGNWVTGWGGSHYVTETTPAGQRVLRLFFPEGTVYRGGAVPFGQLSAASLRAGMDAMHPRK
jgi:hypothetical protein